jgi:TonB family protein
MSGPLGTVALSLASALTIAIAATPARPFGFSDLALGQPVAKLIKAHGSAEVETTDVGHVWTWDMGGDKVRVTTDDDGIVHLYDVLPSPKAAVTFPLPATPPLLLDFGGMTAGEAQGRLASIADFSAIATFPDTGAKADVQAYTITPATEAILFFEDSDKTLRESFYGERAYLVRDGLVPPAASASKPHFTAPVLVHAGAADYPSVRAQGDAYIRMSVDKNGGVSDASVYISSGDIDLDRAAVAGARMYTFKPATQDGTPVSAVFFHKELFRRLPAHA